MYENPWIYNEQPFLQEDVGNYVGFVYLITDLLNQKFYIGKKIFFNRFIRKPLKGKTRRRIERKPSDWQEYYGSNEKLRMLVESTDKALYKREILHLCRNKSQMSYLETKEILVRDALIDERYYNDWVSAKITRKQLHSVYVSAV